eukprot:jgi/Chlat1/4963/Chrsp32S04949
MAAAMAMATSAVGLSALPSLRPSARKPSALQGSPVRSSAGKALAVRPLGQQTAQTTSLSRAPLRVSAAQQAYICMDCGYIYQDKKVPFDKLPNSYGCPVCDAPKRRFKPYSQPVAKNANDLKVRKARKADIQQAPSSNSSGVLVAAGGFAAGLLALFIYLNSTF